MEQQNTLAYVKSQLESLLEFNNEPFITDNAWQFVQDSAQCPAGVTYLSILRACMTPESFREYAKSLAAKYSKKA